MVKFLATGAGSVNDMYGTISLPKTDLNNGYTDRVVTKSTDNTSYNFIALRSRAPNDTAGKDVTITCGTDMNFVWIVKPAGDTGNWTFKTLADCTVVEDTVLAPKTSTTIGTVKKPAGASYLAVASIASATLLHTLY